MQVESFLSRFPPFDALNPEALQRVAASAQIEFFPAGSLIIRREGPPSDFLYVVRRGSVELLVDDVAIDLLDEGELFGHPSLLAGVSPSFDVRAFDDTLCYLVDGDLADELLATRSGVRFLARGLARRNRQTALATETHRLVKPPTTIASLLRRKPVACEPGLSVAQAAGVMARERISSILVQTDALVGIVTDRDLRTKVIAQKRDLGTPVSDVMSTPVVTVSVEETTEDALRLMLQHGFHHLPVTDRAGSVVGVVSDSDLLGLERTAPFALLRGLDRAGTADGVVDQMRRLPEVVASLAEADVDPVDIGHVIASAIDASTKRLIDVAALELGDPPGPWAWIALGSAARHEQSLVTDQDHAMVFSATDVSPDEADRYFEILARRVTDGLEAAGIPRCRGGVMAESAAWRADIATWTETFRTQLAVTDPGGSAFSNIALDYRRVAGALEIESTIDELVRKAAREGSLVRKLAGSAIDLRPPTGFFREFVLESKGSRAGTLDLKHHGITLITNLARTFAVSAGSSATRTVDRLRAATSLGAIDAELGSGLEEGFRLLWRLRLQHQTQQFRDGANPDDAVDPRRLAPVSRRGLRETFTLIAAGQRLMATTFGLRLR